MDPYTEEIDAYALANCVNSDGRIVLLDIRNATLHAGNCTLTVRKGIVGRSEFQFCWSYDNARAGFAL